MTFLQELEPSALWRHFDEILLIPRASKKEERIRGYVIAVADRCGLAHQQDETGNLVVRKPASEGRENAPITVLQSHLDMVTVRNSDVLHDFDKDPIRPREEGGWIYASGTSLGADNGIGVAAMLSLMEDGSAEHGPLEFLFTMDEETGLTGALGIADDLLEGRLLVNLDSEEEGVLTVGCAGAGASELFLELAIEDLPDESPGLEVVIRGLRGGHSGMDIHRHRANAIRLLARCLSSALEARPFRMVSFEGGESHNAIPREARAVLTATAEDLAEIGARLQQTFAVLERELGGTEAGFSASLDEVSARTAWSPEATLSGLRLLEAVPDGVIRMSPDIESLVETSTNLAKAGLQGDELRILLSSRSSVDSALAALRQRIRSVAALAGARVHEDPGYPGWKPEVESSLLARVRAVYRETEGSEPEIGAVHAGLECGILGERYPGMDMISFGPQIESPHSPEERVEIASVARFDRFTRSVLLAISSQEPV